MTYLALANQQVNLVRGIRARVVFKVYDIYQNAIEFPDSTTGKLTITTYLGPDQASILHEYDDVEFVGYEASRVFELADIAALPIGAFMHQLSVQFPDDVLQPAVQGGFAVQMTVQGS